MNLSRTRRPGFAHLEVSKGKVYGSLVVDLWPTNYNLSPAGSAAVAALFTEAIRAYFTRGGRKAVSGAPFLPGNGGESCMSVSRLFVDQLDPLADAVARILSEPTNLEPVRWSAGCRRCEGEVG